MGNSQAEVICWCKIWDLGKVKGTFVPFENDLPFLPFYRSGASEQSTVSMQFQTFISPTPKHHFNMRLFCVSLYEVLFKM